MNSLVMRHEKSTTRSTPYTIPSNIQKHFEHELHFTWTERDPRFPRPVAVVKPIQGPTVLQMVHASPSPSSRPSTQDGRRRYGPLHPYCNTHLGDVKKFCRASKESIFDSIDPHNVPVIEIIIPREEPC
ncbi:hypothetical protein TNCV_3390091 [Trichonephila clavipes]|nr:hypothetical protein TNCV_3390091 [Trichonephila clavipes]